MRTINLRPWREERNVFLQKRFYTQLAVTALLAASIVGASYYYLTVMLNRQQDRNAYLTSEISRLDAKLKEIQELKSKRERLLERLTAIQELQGTRPIIVRTFDELVEVMPDGIHYQSLNRSGEEMSINGLAVANEDVPSLMRTLNDSIWFGEPSLSRVTTQNGLKSFNLRVPLERPDVEEAAQ